MALRSEAFLAFCLVAAAQPVIFEARQDRLFRAKPASLTVDDSGVRAAREGKTWHWKWDEIQQFTLRGDSFVIRTYEDVQWQGWRDREWEFDKVPAGTAEKLAPILQQHLGAKFDTRVALNGAEPAKWTLPAKLQERLGGPEGELRVYADRLTFDSTERNASRTWLIQHLDTISSAGPFDLTIRTLTNEDHQFRLKRPMPEQEYEQLWRLLERRRRR